MSELLKINVNDHAEKKNGLTYLSWAWAWAEVLKLDPQATWQTHANPDGLPCLFLPDASAMVGVTVTIKGHAKTCWLPVMNHRNQAIKNPDAFAVNTAIMRCLAKAIAMHGLGLYIYAGEDLPESEQVDQDSGEIIVSAEQTRQKRQGVMGATLPAVEAALDAKTKTGLAKLAFEVGEAFKHPKEGAGLAFDRVELAGLESDEKLYLWSLLPSNIRSALKTEGQHRAMAGVPTPN